MTQLPPRGPENFDRAEHSFRVDWPRKSDNQRYWKSCENATYVGRGDWISTAQIEELSHFAEFVVAGGQQLFVGLLHQHEQLPLENFVEEAAGGLGIGVRAAFGFRDDFVDDAEFLEVFGGDLQSDRRGFSLSGIAPHDGGAAFRRNHRIKTVFENVDAIADGYGQSAARAAFSCDGDNDRHRQARHLAQIAGDGLGLAALLGVDAGIGAGSIDEGQDGPAKFGGQLHDAQCLAISLGLGLAKIPLYPLLGVAAFLVADHRDRTATKFCQAGDQRLIVAKIAITVQLDEVGEKHADNVESVWPILVPRNLGALPGAQMGVELAAEFGDLEADALEFGVGGFIAGQLAQVFDVFLQALDFFLAFVRAELGFVLVFILAVFGAHAVAAISIARSPQIWRTASTSSGLERTRCWACSIATEPSGECSSNTTAQLPGKLVNNVSRRSRASWLMDWTSRRTRNSWTAARSATSSRRRASCKDKRVPASSICTRALRR